jgi:hypothetical protein
MAQSALARTKINTKVTQPAPGQPSRRPAGRPKPGRPPKGSRVSGDTRESVRQPDRPVIELEFGILVYPPETDGEPWRAVFTENGRRKFRQGATEAKLAAKLEKVKERLQVDAANMERPGADLIAHYLVNAPHLVALVRAGAVFKDGKLVERPEDQSPEASTHSPTATGNELAAAA